MATLRDPIKCFAPIEVIERLLSIRGELGYNEMLFLTDTFEMADLFDAYGFDVYSFSSSNKTIDYGEYRAAIVPGGFRLHGSVTAH